MQFTDYGLLIIVILEPVRTNLLILLDCDMCIPAVYRCCLWKTLFISFLAAVFFMRCEIIRFFVRVVGIFGSVLCDDCSDLSSK